MTFLMLAVGLVVILVVGTYIVVSLRKNVYKGELAVKPLDTIHDRKKKEFHDLVTAGRGAKKANWGEGGLASKPDAKIWDLPFLESRFLREDNGIYHKAEIIPDSSWGDIIYVLDQMTTMPVEVNELLRILDSPDSSAANIADVVDGSVSITAMVLKLVNSPYYGLKNEVTDITHAVSFLGFNEIRQLVLTMNLFSKPVLRNDSLNVDELFDHSVASALITTWLVKKVRRKINIGLSGTGAMLQGIGKLFMLNWRRDRFIKTIQSSRERNIPLMEAELEDFGLTHAMVGSLMSQKWLMPDTISRLIKGCHLPELDPELPEMAVVHLSAQIASQHLGLNDGDITSDIIPPDIVEFLSLEDETVSGLVTWGFERYWESTGSKSIKSKSTAGF